MTSLRELKSIGMILIRNSINPSHNRGADHIQRDFAGYYMVRMLLMKTPLVFDGRNIYNVTEM